MNILAIMGTTRKKGDSYQVIRKMEEEMNRLEQVEVEYLYLEDFELGYCRGCGACFRKGEEFCPKKGTTAILATKMINADGVILASPVYAHQVTAIMKNFVDHFAYFFHRPRFFNKPAIVLSTTGGSGLRETLAYLRFVAVGWGLNVTGKLGIISKAFHNEPQYREKKMTDIRKAVQRMMKAVKTKVRPCPGFYELVFFRGMRLKARYNECDRRYWEERGWFEKSYFTGGPVNPFANAFVAVLEKIAVVLMNQSFKTVNRPKDGHTR